MECQPSLASIGDSEMPPPVSTVFRALPEPARVTRSAAGSSSPSACAAASTAPVASSVAAVAPALSPFTRLPPANTIRPSRPMLTVAWLPKTS